MSSLNSCNSLMNFMVIFLSSVSRDSSRQFPLTNISVGLVCLERDTVLIFLYVCMFQMSSGHVDFC